MGGAEMVDWMGALGASFDAALAREEDLAAADLAFSLSQDVDLREAIRRSRAAWTLVDADGGLHPVAEVGADYVRAGALVARTGGATVRSIAGAAPRISPGTFLELLSAACRAGACITLDGVRGRLIRVAKDHVAVGTPDGETMVGLTGLRSVRLEEGLGYSASRGFSG